MPKCAVLPVLAVLILLQGCQIPGPEREPPALPAELQGIADQAARASASGDHATAAEIYARLTRLQSESPHRWRLRQAASLARAGQYHKSNAVLATVDDTFLLPPDQARYALTGLENAVALLDSAAIADFRQLLNNRRQYLPDDEQDRLSLITDTLRGVPAERGALALALLTGGADALQREAAFAALAQMPFTELQRRLLNSTKPVEQNWLLAAQVARRKVVERQFELRFAGIDELLARASQASLPPTQQAFVDLYLDGFEYPRSIAVLLPASGRLATAADAVRKGILSAWLMLEPGRRPALEFIDIAAGPRGAYYEALEIGADLMLGPLDSEAVNALATMPDRQLPLLALNMPAGDDERSDSLPPPLAASHFFALPPEDSARDSAAWALDEQLRRFVMFGPADRTGERLLDRFAERVREGGGQILQRVEYPRGQIEFTDLLMEHLGIVNSQRRHRELQELLGEELGFRQRADENIDAVLLAADERQARLLAPQLKYVDADYLPVYATEQIYRAGSDPSSDRDLDRIRFTIAAWQLGDRPQPAIESVRRWYPELGNKVLARLFALGRDSLLLIPHLQLLAGDDSVRLLAASGALYINAKGVVQRELQRAHYRNGRARLVRQ